MLCYGTGFLTFPAVIVVHSSRPLSFLVWFAFVPTIALGRRDDLPHRRMDLRDDFEFCFAASLSRHLFHILSS
uniref:Putative secreted peptide n=1 Tax=Anopheles braziliensis TaxID=58242 RepID=A0A2M3ZUJ4_9DIPT